jgi:hypothetical protein
MGAWSTGPGARGLDVVVAVEEDRGPAGNVLVFGHDYGVAFAAGGGHDLGVEAHGFELGGEPVGALADGGG